MDADAVFDTVIAFCLFSLTSSSVYIINDLNDIEADRAHPSKSKKRPLAAGWITPIQAKWQLVGVIVVLIVGLSFNTELIGVLVSYLVINLLYTFRLKYLPVIDIFCIASGFVLRIYAGAADLDVPVSGWMFITTLCLALFLASIKRKQELIYGNKGSRKVLDYYTTELVDKYAQMSATAALLFYSLFVLTENHALVYSIPFVIYGIFRYWYIVDADGSGESPTDVLLTDIHLIATISCWIGVNLWVLWA